MTRHACPTCHTLHDVPKARPVLMTYLRAAAFTTVEVLAALALDGWLAVALWLVAAWNVFLVVLLTVGLANVAANVLKAEEDPA